MIQLRVAMITLSCHGIVIGGAGYGGGDFQVKKLLW